MFALDTNTISYYMRGDPQVVSNLQALTPSQIAVPAVVVYELRYGLMRLPAPAAKSRLLAVEQFLGPVRVVVFDGQAAAIAATIRAHLEKIGQGIGPHDVMIAASVLALGATLVTRNVRDFQRVPGLAMVNWHDDPGG